MRVITLIILLAVGTGARPSDSFPTWRGWELKILSDSCRLSTSVESVVRQDSVWKGFLSGTPYEAAAIWIYAQTEVATGRYAEPRIGPARALVHIFSNVELDQNEMVELVDLGGVSSFGEERLHRGKLQMFQFSGEETELIIEQLESSEPVELVFYLSSGKRVATSIGPYINVRFHVWRRALEACIETNLTLTTNRLY
ncbi:MAG: hypothetical protein AAF680_00120 [Pseudomonadota bacterium]